MEWTKARMCLGTYLVHSLSGSTTVYSVRTRSDGKLFKLARLKAITKTRELCIRELLFADDAAIVAHTLEDIREICKQFEQAATMFALTINTKKTLPTTTRPNLNQSTC